jgi:hypothetical protein
MSERPSYTESELVELVRSIDVRAPEELHRKIEALVEEQSTRRRSPWARSLGGSRGLSLGLGGAVAVAAAAAALVLSFSGAGSGALTLPDASALTLRAATMPAPAESPSNGTELAANVDGVPFPYWEEHFGWRSSGARSDSVDGRTVRTVFYTSGDGRRVGYAIIAGPAPRASGGKIAMREGTPYRFLKENGIWVVTWIRDGHMCVVSGRGMDWVTLLKLASWNDRGMAA